MSSWKLITEEHPPQNKVLKTKIIDAEGKEHNVQQLMLSGRLWWLPDMSMYVYYAPPHWWCHL